MRPHATFLVDCTYLEINSTNITPRKSVQRINVINKGRAKFVWQRMHFPFYSRHFLEIHKKSIRFVHWQANERVRTQRRGRANWWLYQLTVRKLYCPGIGNNLRLENCDNPSCIVSNNTKLYYLSLPCRKTNRPVADR